MGIMSQSNPSCSLRDCHEHAKRLDDSCSRVFRILLFPFGYKVRLIIWKQVCVLYLFALLPCVAEALPSEFWQMPPELKDGHIHIGLMAYPRRPWVIRTSSDIAHNCMKRIQKLVLGLS